MPKKDAAILEAMQLILKITCKSAAAIGVAIPSQMGFVNDAIQSGNLPVLQSKTPILAKENIKLSAITSSLPRMQEIAYEKPTLDQQSRFDFVTLCDVVIDALSFFAPFKIKEIDITAAKSAISDLKDNIPISPPRSQKLKTGGDPAREFVVIGGFGENTPYSLAPRAQQVDGYLSSLRNKWSAVKQGGGTDSPEYMKSVVSPTFETGDTSPPYKLPWVTVLAQQLRAAADSENFDLSSVVQYLATHATKYLSDAELSASVSFRDSVITVSVSGSVCEISDETISFLSPDILAECKSLFSHLSDCLDEIDARIVESKTREFLAEIGKIRTTRNLKEYFRDVRAAASEIRQIPAPRVLIKREIRESVESISRAESKAKDLSSRLPQRYLEQIGSPPKSLSDLREFAESLPEFKDSMRELERVFESAAESIRTLMSQWENLASPDNVESCIMHVVKYAKILVAADAEIEKGDSPVAETAKEIKKSLLEKTANQ
jgi:hypothetical protein